MKRRPPYELILSVVAILGITAWYWQLVSLSWARVPPIARGGAKAAITLLHIA